jgi:hypothetical protein
VERKQEKFSWCGVPQFHHQNFKVQSTAYLLGVMYVCKAQETVSSTLFKYGEKNQTLFATHGTTFKAWIQIHGKLEAVSTALAAVILNDQ